MARRRGNLTPEDKDLWAQVARTVSPLHPVRRQPLPEPPALKPARGALQTNGQPAPPFPATGKVRLSTAAPQSRFDPAPSPAQKLAVQPLRMDHKTHRQMTQGKLRPESRIDLHGMTLAVAQPALTSFLFGAHARGLRLVLVITGKGRRGDEYAPLPVRPGALRHSVPHWLHMAPLSQIVLQATPAHRRHGGEGAYYVYLRRG